MFNCNQALEQPATFSKFVQYTAAVKQLVVIESYYSPQMYTKYKILSRSNSRSKNFEAGFKTLAGSGNSWMKIENVRPANVCIRIILLGPILAIDSRIAEAHDCWIKNYSAYSLSRAWTEDLTRWENI